MEHDAFWVQTGSERAGRVKENDEGLGLSTKIMEAEQEPIFTGNVGSSDWKVLGQSRGKITCKSGAWRSDLDKIYNTKTSETNLSDMCHCGLSLAGSC